MAIIESNAQDIIEAGPAILAPTAGKKKIPVPMIEFITINRRTL